jgi:uncharacterized protein
MTMDQTNADAADPLDLSSCPLLGSVVGLDRNRVGVELSDPKMAAEVTVSDLVALPTGREFLVGLVEAIAARPAVGSSDAGVDNPTAGDSLVELSVMPIGTFRPGHEATTAAFRRGASAYPHIGVTCHLVAGESLRKFMAVLAEEVAPAERLVLGRYVSDRETMAIADGNRLFQRHLAVVGSTGAGKSWAITLMLERISRLSHADVIVLDLHGEYAPLHDEDGEPPIARRFRVAGPADLGRAADDLLYLPYWALQRDELMALVLNPDDPHASDHVFRLTENLQALKEVSLLQAGRGDAVATFTVDSPIPYELDRLVHVLRKEDTEKIPQPPANRVEPGPYYGRLTGLVSRLEARAADPRYGFIFSPPEDAFRYEWLTATVVKLLGAGPGATGIKIVDLSEVPSAVVPLVAGVIGRLVYEVQFWIDPARRTPICLVCDEAHLYLPPREESDPVHRAALRSFEAIAKEGRKYGVALVLVTQRPTDVSRTILSQCNNFVVMRLTDDYDQEMVERLLPESLSGIVGVLPALEPGEAVVVGDAMLLPTRIMFDPPAVRPASATQPYWSQWREQPSSRDAIVDGVEALRRQLRAPSTVFASLPDQNDVLGATETGRQI